MSKRLNESGIYEPNVQHNLSIVHFIDENGDKDYEFIIEWASIISYKYAFCQTKEDNRFK